MCVIQVFHHQGAKKSFQIKAEVTLRSTCVFVYPANAVRLNLGNEALVLAQPGLPHGSLAVEASGELLQLLLSDQLGPQRQLALVLSLLQTLPRLRQHHINTESQSLI